MFWDDFIQISSILHLMKWVMNENSISWCLVFFPFKQMYTTKVRRNNICAAITFVELQGRTFFLFHNEFSTFNFFWALGFLNPPMANNSDVMLSFVIVFCFVNQFVWDKLFGLIYQILLFWKDCSRSPLIIYWRDIIGFKEFFKYIVHNVTFIISQLLTLNS